jgi:hypothetical protein
VTYKASASGVAGIAKAQGQMFWMKLSDEQIRGEDRRKSGKIGSM